MFGCLIMLSLLTFVANYAFVKVIAGVLIAMIFGIYLVYDTQLIANGKRYGLSLDDYVIAAIVIYLDVIYIFLRVLSIMSRK